MRKLVPPIFIAVVIAIFSVAAAAQTNEAFILGKWRFDGKLPPNQSGNSMSWYQEWTFSEGTFIESGYPPLSQKGKYRVLTDENNKLTLELYERSGDLGDKNSKLVIVSDKDRATLKIGQNAGFKKAKPKT